MSKPFLYLALFMLGIGYGQQTPTAVDYFNALNNDQNTVSRLCWKYLIETATSNNLRKNENTRQQLLGATRRAQMKLSNQPQGFDNDTQLMQAFVTYYQQVLDGYDRDCGQWLAVQKSMEPDWSTWNTQMEGIKKLRETTAQNWTQLNAAKVDFAENHKIQLNRPNWLRAEKLEQVRGALQYAQDVYSQMLDLQLVATPWIKSTEQPDPLALQQLQQQLLAAMARHEPHIKSLTAFQNDTQLQLAAQEALGTYHQVSDVFLPKFQAFLLQKKQIEQRQQQLDAMPASAEKNEQIKSFNQDAQALQTALQQQNQLLKSTLDAWNSAQKQWRETYYSFITSHIPQD